MSGRALGGLPVFRPTWLAGGKPSTGLEKTGAGKDSWEEDNELCFEQLKLENTSKYVIWLVRNVGLEFGRKAGLEVLFEELHPLVVIKAKEVDKNQRQSLCEKDNIGREEAP